MFNGKKVLWNPEKDKLVVTNKEDSSPVVDKLVPVGFRVLLNIYQKPKETDAGFILPETENGGMPVMAQICILGSKTLLQKLKIFLGIKAKYKVGQWVYFRKYSVDELKLQTPEGDITLYVLEEDEIIGIAN